MRLDRARMFGPLEGEADVASPLCSNGLSNNRLERPIFAVNTRRKPERDAKASLVRCALQSGRCLAKSDDPRGPPET
jgi:hypothetical protein